MALFERKSDILRRWLAASRPTKYLVFVLVASLVWLWIALGLPPILQYLLALFMVFIFAWLKYGWVIKGDFARRATWTQHRRRKESRDFLRTIAMMTFLPVVFTIRADFWLGIELLGTFLLISGVYILVMWRDLEFQRRLERRWKPK
jgi:hypothetical protein